jgi:hypothetical protein
MRLGTLLTVVALLLLPVVASAQDASEYERLVDEAVSEFDAGHFDEALSAFEQAYKVKPSARALRGVAKALFELRLYSRCIGVIDRALASDVDPLTDSLRADLESLKARALRFVGELAVDIAPAGATILLDSAPIDRNAPLEVGPHTLDASAPGFESQHRKVEIHGGEVTRLSLRLEPIRVASPPPRAEGRSVPLAFGIGAVVASTVAVVGSSIWFVDRGDAVGRCDDAAGAGARCANADSIVFQRDISTWTLSLSSAALVASAVALFVVLREAR